ncbi:hypothetical protein [Vallicoccus soli]|uniref:DUF5709 domain-containing protein n=1 Tax=Vallicoccus soli TaxID=2339232 RepID=A0A3A3Z308_9ACTN|nr:hypothetical protein [Vallicoccus soli]RJK97094.1 hypothetical protein D5H78_07740 [Vallicoccus soli]
MTTPSEPTRPTFDDVEDMEPQDDARPDRIYTGHAGVPERLDDDALNEATEQERVDAGIADYAPSQVPNAQDDLPDGTPDMPAVDQTEIYQEELAEAQRVAREQGS